MYEWMINKRTNKTAQSSSRRRTRSQLLKSESSFCMCSIWSSKGKKKCVFSTCYSSYKISITALTFQVAVKVVPKKAVLVREFVRKNVRREAIVLQKLSHPNIIKMYEVMETENSYYLVLEYADCGEFIKYLSIK